MVYLKSAENVITLGKLIGLLFLFCLPLLSILFLKTKRNDLARPVVGTIFLVYVDVHLKTILAVTLFSTRKNGSHSKASELTPCIFCMYVNRKEEEEGETEQQQTYQFTHEQVHIQS